MSYKNEEKKHWLSMLAQVPSVDLHCDALSAVKNGAKLAERRNKGHFDLQRMKEGGLWVEVLSIFVNPQWYIGEARWRAVEKQLRRLEEALSASDEWRLVTNPKDIEKNKSSGKRSLILEVEGLHSIEDKPDRIQELWERGVRIFTLTWNNSNRFATSCMDEDDVGLKPDGKEMVKSITKMGGIIDLSHASEKTFFDVLEMGITPILSHSALRRHKNSKRNATDEMVRQLGEVGGIIGINFFPGFLSTKSYSKVTSLDIIKHIATACELGGEDLIALGSDFDGVKHLPKDISDASYFWVIARNLSQNGFENDTIFNIMGRNFINFWQRTVK